MDRSNCISRLADLALLALLGPGLGFSAAARDTLPPVDTTTATVTDARGFRLTQRFAEPSVIAGGHLRVNYLLENTGPARSGVRLEIFFLLENTTLVSAPDACRHGPSLSGQEALACDLGDFPLDGHRSLSVTVATSARSRPSVTASAFVGELRADATAHVVHDTVSDSDGDGVSNFIETLRRTDPRDAASVDRRDARIDVLALYTTAAADLYPGSVENRINHFFNVANQAYFSSAARFRLRPVHFQRIGYPAAAPADTMLDELLHGGNSAFARVNDLRQRYGADLVVLFDAAKGESRCGLAPVGGYGRQGDFSDPREQEFGFAWIAIDCPEDLVLAHELGHNMGLTHSHREDGAGGTFDHATGFGVDGEFATIMASPARFSVPERTPVFSNPELSCGGFTCGRPVGEPFAANATAVLNIVAPQIELWRQTALPRLPAIRGKSVLGSATSARLALAGQINDEPAYTATAGEGDVLRLLAEVEVDPEHIGQTGSFHILITVDSEQFHQFDREIGLTLWNGTLGDLRAATFERELRRTERFHIIDNYLVPANLGGIELQVFLAYQAAGDVIYRPQPLRLLFAD